MSATSRVALDGAEPINVRTRLEMLRTWKRFGLREGVYSAAYGALEYVGTLGFKNFQFSIADLLYMTHTSWIWTACVFFRNRVIVEVQSADVTSHSLQC